jgi:hypothetical protein
VGAHRPGTIWLVRELLELNRDAPKTVPHRGESSTARGGAYVEPRSTFAASLVTRNRVKVNLLWATAMGSSCRPEPFGLLHHHRCRLPRTGASEVVLSEGVAELVIDQIAAVVGQVRSIRIDAEHPTFGIQHDSMPFWHDTSPRVR